MRFRIVVVFACAVGLLSATESLLAQRDVPLACCSDLSECGGRQCCSFEFPIPPCSTDQTGYCMAICIWPATPVAEGQ